MFAVMYALQCGLYEVKCWTTTGHVGCFNPVVQPVHVLGLGLHHKPRAGGRDVELAPGSGTPPHVSVVGCCWVLPFPLQRTAEPLPLLTSRWAIFLDYPYPSLNIRLGVPPPSILCKVRSGTLHCRHCTTMAMQEPKYKASTRWTDCYDS